jgi:PKD repeat protein
MMKKVIKSLLAVVAILSIASCQKTPVASFTTDKTEYVAGETIKLTNTSTNGESYKWTFPDGTTGTVESYDFVTNETDPTATLTFKLEAFSKNGKKTNETTKTVNLKAATGNVTFWQMTGSGYAETAVELNGITSTITGENDAAPSCGASGCAVFNNIKVGTYNYAASDGNATWSGTVKVTKNGCTTIELQ